MNINTNITEQLMQSRNGGKIHFAHCGSRSLYAGYVEIEEGTTYKDLVNTYGDNLCQHCFGFVMEAMNVQPAAKPEPKPASDYCAGSDTYNWEGGEPKRMGYMHNNGGHCGECGKWVAIKSMNTPQVRKHKAA